MKPRRMIAGGLALLALSVFNLHPSTAFATTNRVGVITANYTMTASGSGEWDWGIAGILGYSGSDDLDVSITGVIKYEVVQTETNLMIGRLISASANQTASGGSQRHDWDYTAPNPPNPPIDVTYTSV
jgi:hypothetical protein